MRGVDSIAILWPCEELTASQKMLPKWFNQGKVKRGKNPQLGITFSKKLLALPLKINYSLHMENYKGFKFDYDQGFITFYHPDMEEGNGDWSGSASCMEDAMEMIDEMTFEDKI